MKLGLLIALLALSGLSAYRAVAGARAMSAKVLAIYQLPHTAEKFMSEDEYGELVRLATGFKQDRDRFWLVALMSCLVFILAAGAFGLEIRSRHPRAA